MNNYINQKNKENFKALGYCVLENYFSENICQELINQANYIAKSINIQTKSFFLAHEGSINQDKSLYAIIVDNLTILNSSRIY